MELKLESLVSAYRVGVLDRRAFVGRLIAATGSMAAAQLLLESTGLAASLVSEVESRQLDVTSETVTFPSTEGVKVSGYLSAPRGGGRYPGVLVIHENRGLNDHTRDVARRLAAEGFTALAPDLLSRKGGTASMASPEKAREAIMSLPAEASLADLKAALAFLDEHPRVERGKLGSVGFCWGGARSFQLAAESDRLRAAVVFYGSAPPPETLARVRVPVLGLYGETDERITARVPEVAAAMKAHGKPFEYKVYPGAGHAFFNDTGERYDPAAAKDAWQRAVAFLREHLK